jgi:hypothetical protein
VDVTVLIGTNRDGARDKGGARGAGSAPFDNEGSGLRDGIEVGVPRSARPGSGEDVKEKQREHRLARSLVHLVTGPGSAV